MSRGARLVLLVALSVALAGSDASLGVVDGPQGTVPAPSVQGQNFTVEEDQTYDGVVATFESPWPPTTSFSISVNWGDGSSSAGTYVFVDRSGQAYRYRAHGSHRYTSSGTYTTIVTVTDSAGASGVGSGTATVTPRATSPPPPPPPPAPPPPPPPPPPPQADLVLQQTHVPGRPRARAALTYAFEVRNRGPATATGVRLSNRPPEGSTFVSASVERLPAGVAQSCTAGPDGTLGCALGTLAPGGGARVIHVVRLGPARLARNAAQAAADQVDPVATDNATAEEVAVAPPSPMLGRTANIAPVSGVVLYRPRGGARFLPLTEETQLPFGSQIDTRRGRVRLQSARGGGGAVDTADFYAGLFALFQARVPGAFTELRLAGGSFAGCPPGLRRPAAAGSPIRRLWGDGKGRFRTRGRSGAATVRGTRWLTLDRCDGTLVRVVIGRVLVRDFVRNRTVPLRAGQSYLARARR